VILERTIGLRLPSLGDQPVVPCSAPSPAGPPTANCAGQPGPEPGRESHFAFAGGDGPCSCAADSEAEPRCRPRRGAPGMPIGPRAGAARPCLECGVFQWRPSRRRPDLGRPAVVARRRKVHRQICGHGAVRRPPGEKRRRPRRPQVEALPYASARASASSASWLGGCTEPQPPQAPGAGGYCAMPISGCIIIQERRFIIGMTRR
jgi:hypothetical protein